MNLEFAILCPGRTCGKCRRMIKLVEELKAEYYPEATIAFVSQIEELVKFNTWVLPSLFVNNLAVAKGFVPDKKMAIERINKIIDKPNA